MGRDQVCEEVASQVRSEVEDKWVVVSDSLVLTSLWENPVREPHSG